MTSSYLVRGDVAKWLPRAGVPGCLVWVPHRRAHHPPPVRVLGVGRGQAREPPGAGWSRTKQNPQICAARPDPADLAAVLVASESRGPAEGTGFLHFPCLPQSIHFLVPLLYPVLMSPGTALQPQAGLPEHSSTPHPQSFWVCTLWSLWA